MTESLSDLIARLEALRAAATPGEWRHIGYELGSMTGYVDSVSDVLTSVVIDHAGFSNALRTKANHRANARLIAAAVTAMPALLAAAKRVAEVERERDRQAAEVAEAWAVLGTSAAAVSDDPDTAHLADSIRISLDHERSDVAAAKEIIAEQETRIAQLEAILKPVAEMPPCVWCGEPANFYILRFRSDPGGTQGMACGACRREFGDDCQVISETPAIDSAALVAAFPKAVAP